MGEVEDTIREGISTHIQAHARPLDIPEGSVLTGWALVEEWMKPDGEKVLMRGWSVGMTSWGANGLWHEALFGTGWDDE